RSAQALATDTRDLPFAMLYLADQDGGTLSLCGASGIAAGHPAAPRSVPLDATSIWPFDAVLRRNQPEVVTEIAARFGADFPAGAWDQPPGHAALIPIPARGETARAGVLVAGLSPFRLFDDDYRRFLDLAA